MNINLPEYYELRKVIIKILPTLAIYKDNRHSTKLTTLPPIKELGEWAGIYIVEKDGVICYIGTTYNLRNRIFSHRKQFKVDYVWFYEENDGSLQQMIEMVYKFKYMGKNKITN